MRPRRFYIGFPPALVEGDAQRDRVRDRRDPARRLREDPRDAPAGAVRRRHVLRPARRRGARAASAPIERAQARARRGRLTRRARRARRARAGARARRAQPRRAEAAERGLDELDDALGPDAYWRQRTWKRVAVIFAGPGDEPRLRGRPLRDRSSCVGGTGRADATTVDAGRARRSRRAGRAIGLQPGDRIVAINGDAGRRRRRSATRSATRAASPLTLTVERDGETVDARPGPAATTRRRLPARLHPRAARRSAVGEASALAAADRAASRRRSAASLARLVTRRGPQGDLEPGRDRPGLVRGARAGLRRRTSGCSALISLSLALLNLLPLLPLDGGHIAFSIVEGIRGRAVAREVYERVSAVGIALVLLLFFIGLSNDIGRLGGREPRLSRMASERSDQGRRRRRSAAARRSSCSR